MSTNPARVLAATGIALGAILLLSRGKRRSRGSAAPQVQEGLPESWPAAVTLGMGKNFPSKMWDRQQAPAEIIELASALEERGMWPNRLGPFLVILAHRANRGKSNGPGGWFGLTPDLVFTKDLAPLRPYPDLLKEPRFAVMAAARRIDELQRRYEGMGLTWLDVARMFVPQEVPEAYLATDRPGVVDASAGNNQFNLIDLENAVWVYPESRDKYIGLLEGMRAYAEAAQAYKMSSAPWMSGLVSELPLLQGSMLADQVQPTFPYDANDLFGFMDIDFKV